MISWRGIRGALASVFVAIAVPTLTTAAWSQPAVNVIGGTDDEATIGADGGVTHQDAQFQYPKQIGDMPLRKVNIYGDADVSAEYTLQGGGNGDAWISFFIYPGLLSLDEEASGVEESLIKNMSATAISPPASPPESLKDGRFGWYRGTLRGVPLTTGYMVVRRGDWMMKARFSIPDAGGQVTIDRTITSLGEIPWGWVPQTRYRTDQKLAQN